MDELVATRTRLRTKATKLCNDLKAYRQQEPKSLDQDQLALKVHHVQRLLHELQTIQTQLDKTGQADESNHIQMMEDEVFLGSRVLARLEKAEEAKGKAESKSSSAKADLTSSLSVKIPVFHGDVMKWSEFWELFLISVHENSNFADVQKFVALKSHLAGSALRVIQGIPVSGNGYTEAVEALKERFERDDVCRETLMKELLNMPSVRSNDLKALRSLTDHITAHTRALNSLGVSSDSFSSLLLPIVKEKLPESWRVEWARRDQSEFSDFLAFLQQEIRVQESARGTVTSDTSSKAQPPATPVSATLSAQRMPRAPTGPSSTRSLCPICNRGPHRISQCESFARMDIEARWGAALAARSCYRCLVVGHRARNCRAGLCRECGQNHHVLLHNPSSSSSPQAAAARMAPPAAPPRLAQAPTSAYSPGPQQTAATRLTPLAAPFKPTTAPASSMQTETASREAPSSGRHCYQGWWRWKR